jgi:hypothetical protein
MAYVLVTATTIRGRDMTPDHRATTRHANTPYLCTVWQSEEWLQQYAKPEAESGGQGVQAQVRPGAAAPPNAKEAGEQTDVNMS